MSAHRFPSCAIKAPAMLLTHVCSLWPGRQQMTGGSTAPLCGHACCKHVRVMLQLVLLQASSDNQQGGDARQGPWPTASMGCACLSVDVCCKHMYWMLRLHAGCASHLMAVRARLKWAWQHTSAAVWVCARLADMASCCWTQCYPQACNYGIMNLCRWFPSNTRSSSARLQPAGPRTRQGAADPATSWGGPASRVPASR